MSLATRISEIGGRRIPLLRWSVWRMVLGSRNLREHWQVGDGREEALAEHVTRTAAKGDLDDAIRAIDDFCYRQSVMMNVGDEKGELLDAAIRRAQPRRLLELGTYCGYSALRTTRVMGADARLYSVEFSPANAEIARRILDHAGAGDRVTVVVGTLGDGGRTLAALESEHGFAQGSVDFLFMDHDKDAYLADLERVVERRWLRTGAVVVADNVKYPGVPGYREYMREREGRQWRTIEHETHLEYQTLFKDLVVESEYLGD
ncbi:MAG TPA: O-methyltransferase [Thermoleophilaceae bacterium]|nr:O-methyltransferase [Thermoleophilaceae bacterium]